MTLKPNKNRWTSSEITSAVVLLYTGIKISRIAELLQRSPESVQKKLARLNALPPKDAEEKLIISSHAPQDLTIDETHDFLASVLDKIGYDHHQGESHTIEALIDKLIAIYPLEVVTTAKARDNQSAPLEHDSQWQTLTEICKFLNTHHIYPRKLDQKAAQDLGFSHVIRGTYKRPQCLLKQANQIKIDQNRDILYLKDYTE